MDLLQESDLIILKGCRFFSHIGYFDFEQEEGQMFELDLSYSLGRPKAVENDALEDSLSYAEVFSTLQQFMKGARHRLLEHAANDLAETLLKNYPVIDALELVFKKPEAPVDGSFSYMAYRIQRRRWSKVALALGANLGDAVHTLASCSKEIFLNPDFRRQKISSLYRSKAWGVTEQEDFYNACLLAETTLSPWQLLAYAKGLEHKAGRREGLRWGPRTLDVDLLTYEGCRMNHPELTLPHPRMEQRPFVMVPLRELETGIIGEDPELICVGAFPAEATPITVERDKHGRRD